MRGSAPELPERRLDLLPDLRVARLAGGDDGEPGDLVVVGAVQLAGLGRAVQLPVQGRPAGEAARRPALRLPHAHRLGRAEVVAPGADRAASASPLDHGLDALGGQQIVGPGGHDSVGAERKGHARPVEHQPERGVQASGDSGAIAQRRALKAATIRAACENLSWALDGRMERRAG